MKTKADLPFETMAELDCSPEPDSPEFPVFVRNASLIGQGLSTEVIARYRARIVAAEKAERAASEANARADQLESDAAETIAQHLAAADGHDAEECEERNAADLAPNRKEAREHDEAADRAASAAAEARAAAEAVEASVMEARALAHDATATAAEAQARALGWFQSAAAGWLGVAVWRQRRRASEASIAAKRLRREDGT